MASRYPPTSGEVPIRMGARPRGSGSTMPRIEVGGGAWLVQFMRWRLIEVALAIAAAAGAWALMASYIGLFQPVTLEVTDLQPGAYRVYEGQYSRLYVLRTADDVVRAYTVPLHGGKVSMPMGEWGRSAYDCSDFGPEATGTALATNGVFSCRDADAPSWGALRWRWNFDGTSAPVIDDMYLGVLPRVKSDQSGRVVRIYRWDIRW